jgi:hypothetical protein
MRIVYKERPMAAIHSLFASSGVTDSVLQVEYRDGRLYGEAANLQRLD